MEIDNLHKIFGALKYTEPAISLSSPSILLTIHSKTPGLEDSLNPESLPSTMVASIANMTDFSASSTWLRSHSCIHHSKNYRNCSGVCRSPHSPLLKLGSSSVVFENFSKSYGEKQRIKQVSEPAGYRYDRTVVREGLEAVFIVVSTIARLATLPAKEGVFNSGVENGL